VRRRIQKNQGEFVRHLDIAILGVFTCVAIPLLTSDSALDPGLLPRFVAWAVMLFILSAVLLARILKSATRVDSRIIESGVFFAFLGYFVVSIVSLSRATNRAEGVFEVLKTFMSLAGLVFGTVILSRDSRYVSVVSKGVVILAVLMSLIGFHQYLTLGIFQVRGPHFLTGTMGQKNLFASALFLTLPFCSYVALTARRCWRVTCIITSISVLLLILLSQTRTVWLGVLGSTILTVVVIAGLHRYRVLSIPQKTTETLRRTVAWTLVGLTLIGTIFASVRARSVPLRRTLAEASATESVDERFSVWGKTLELVGDNFAMGVGAGNWRIRFPSYGLPTDLPKDRLERTFFVRPHNDYLWVLAELGVFGLLLYLLIFAISLFYVLRVLTLRPAADDIVLSASMFFGLVGYMIIAFFCFPKERVVQGTFLILLMTIVTSKHLTYSVCNGSSRRSGIIAFAVISLVLLPIAMAVGCIRLRAEIHTKRALTARKVGDWPKVISEIDSCYSAFASLDPMSTPLQWYRGEANFLMGRIEQALGDYRRAHEDHPFHFHVLNNLGTCYELTGNRNEAIRCYKEALRVFPRFDDALANLVAVYLRDGKYAEAYSSLSSSNLTRQNATLERYLRIAKDVLDNGDRPTEAKEAIARYNEVAGARESGESDGSKGVYRLWSSMRGRHFYTINEQEKDEFLQKRQGWVAEGIAYRAFDDAGRLSLRPVHRLYSPALDTYFYTISPKEKDKLLQDYRGSWQYQGIAFYAFPDGQHPVGTSPVYRFWGQTLGHHLYTIDPQEKDKLIRDYRDMWSFEGVAWHAYK